MPSVLFEANSPEQLHDRWKVRFPEKLSIIMQDSQGSMGPIPEGVVSVSFSEEVRVQVASDRPIEKRYERRVFKLGQEQLAANP